MINTLDPIQWIETTKERARTRLTSQGYPMPYAPSPAKTDVVLYDPPTHDEHRRPAILAAGLLGRHVQFEIIDQGRIRMTFLRRTSPQSTFDVTIIKDALLPQAAAEIIANFLAKNVDPTVLPEAVAP